jgi:GMP synthase (glutamine-hydrolysing)
MRNRGPKILLLQIRDVPRVRAEELDSFVQYSGLNAGQIDVLNVFDRPVFDHRVLIGYDSLFVGGASEASVMEPENYPFVASCTGLMQFCVAEAVPVFASCFGFQLAVVALGGELVRDRSGFEMGTPPISLAPAASTDPLFHDTPDGFHAVSVHKERAPQLPPGTELLAFTAACPHAFRVNDKPFWAFQFHPEVDRRTLVERLTIFRDQYTEGAEHLEEVLASAVETPESNGLVRKFVERILK